MAFAVNEIKELILRVKYNKMIEQVIFSWMNIIFITKQINKKEFKWKNIKSLIKKSGYVNINKDEIQNIISKFKGNINLEKTKMYNETINEIQRMPF